MSDENREIFNLNHRMCNNTVSFHGDTNYEPKTALVFFEHKFSTDLETLFLIVSLLKMVSRLLLPLAKAIQSIYFKPGVNLHDPISRLGKGVWQPHQFSDLQQCSKFLASLGRASTKREESAFGKTNFRLGHCNLVCLAGSDAGLSGSKL